MQFFQFFSVTKTCPINNALSAEAKAFLLYLQRRKIAKASFFNLNDSQNIVSCLSSAQYHFIISKSLQFCLYVLKTHENFIVLNQYGILFLY